MSRARRRSAAARRVASRRGGRLALGLAALISLGGCALNQTARRDVTAALEQYERQAALDAGAYGSVGADVASTRAASQPLDTAPESPRSLRDYILLALEQNPEIKAAEEIARTKVARVPQVTALPDPMLTTKTLVEPVRTAEGDNYFVLGLQQKFPVPEKLDRAGRVALQEARMALKELQRARLRVIANVKRAYFRLYVVDTTIEIDVANQDLLRGLIDAVRAQVAAGRRSQGDVLRAEVELSTLESKLIELRQQRESAAAMLNRILDRPSATPVPRPAAFELRDVDVKLDALLATAAEHNPDLQRLREQLERDREAVELARLAYWPDFTVGLEWMRISPRAAFQPPPNPRTGMPAPVNRMSENGSDNWAITVGLNIPIWFEKIKGGIREARGRLLAAQYQYASAHSRVRFEVEDAFARVRAQRELADLFQNTIIPQALQAYEVSRAAYSSGMTDFLFVIDNWQKWLTFTIQYHRALGELERSAADLEEALGLSLSEAGG